MGLFVMVAGFFTAAVTFINTLKSIKCGLKTWRYPSMKPLSVLVDFCHFKFFRGILSIPSVLFVFMSSLIAFSFISLILIFLS